MASSSARRAKPSAAAPTVERNTSRVAMAILNPCPGSPSRFSSRHPAILECKTGQRMRCDDLEPLGNLQTRRVGRHHDGREAAGSRRSAGAGEDHIMVGDAAIGNPGLLAVENILVARSSALRVRWRRRRTRHSARSARRLEAPALGHRRQEVACCSIGAEQADRAAAQTLHGKGEIGEPMMARQGLADDAQAAHIQAVMQPPWGAMTAFFRKPAVPSSATSARQASSSSPE